MDLKWRYDLNTLKSDYVNSNSNFALLNFSNLVFNYLNDDLRNIEDLIVLCIGTDRSTGDSLGPLVGHKLLPLIKNYENIHLYGHLHEPVHAKNIGETIEKLYRKFHSPYIVAIDSSLGMANRIGFLSIKNSPLKPGAGVNKDLPPVGDLSITGIVNMAGMMEYMVLQNTRLSIVMKMAEIIYKSLYLSFIKLEKEFTNGLGQKSIP